MDELLRFMEIRSQKKENLKKREDTVWKKRLWQNPMAGLPRWN